MRRAACIMASMLAVSPTALPAHAGPFAAVAAIGDDELSMQRGGFVLPNGLALAIGITIDTNIDGRLALRTIVSSEGPIRVFGASAGAARAGTTPAPQQAITAAPGISIDRNGAGTIVTPAAVSVVPNVRVGVGQDMATSQPSGPELAVVAGGPAVPDIFGSVRIEQTDKGSAIVLVGPSLEVRHLVGAATGVAIANTADNRSIDTIATINIDFQNAQPLIGSSALRVDGIAAGALALRTPS